MSTAHPVLPPFEYVRPAGLAEASRFLAQHPGEARIFLGGTDTLVRLRNGSWHARYLVDVKHLPGLRALSFDATGLCVGAAVSLNALLAAPTVRQHYSALAEAAATVASYPVRNRATLVGNICNASPGGDLLGASLVLDASARIFGPTGERLVPLAAFIRGPGSTTLQPGEIVTAVLFPVPQPGAAAHIRKLGRNAAGDLAIVGVAVLGWPAADAASGYRFRIALTAVAPIPLRVTAAEALLSAEPITEARLVDAAEAALAASRPIDDLRAGARYRRLMVRNLTLQTLRQIWSELQTAH